MVVIADTLLYFVFFYFRSFCVCGFLLSLIYNRDIQNWWWKLSASLNSWRSSLDVDMVKRNSRTRTEHCFLAHPLQEDQICRTDAEICPGQIVKLANLKLSTFPLDFLSLGSLLLPTSLEQMLFAVWGEEQGKKSIKLMHNGAEGYFLDFSFRSTERLVHFTLRNVLLN